MRGDVVDMRESVEPRGGEALRPVGHCYCSEDSKM